MVITVRECEGAITTGSVMDLNPTETARTMSLTFDPDDLTCAQRYGDACVVCHKKWPRPRILVGRLPDGATVLACHDCAEALLPLPAAGALPFPMTRTRAALP